ncbi:hypothetical protein SALBM311S_01729 [Streptomyces alboniger]
MPLNKALVEIWHCDALGEYSGFVGANGHNEPDNGTFLRGGVLTNSSGVASITSVYPGWYQGRCVHIHVKVHTNVTLTSDGSFTGGQEKPATPGSSSSTRRSRPESARCRRTRPTRSAAPPSPRTPSTTREAPRPPSSP